MGKSERREFLFNKQEKLDISCADILAAGLFLVMFGWYIYVAFIGLNPADESFYYTIPQRFFQEDRLFVDEWHVSQLSSLFQILPYKIYTSVTGGTDGIILYMRFVTIVVTTVFYWFFYKKLRAYKVWGVLVTFLLCSFFPGGILALSYYTISIYLLAVVCIVLFLSKNELSMITLILLGVAFSCAVLAQPVLVVLFFLYSFLCLVCSRTKTLFHSFDFVLNSRTWRGISIGCFVSFLCFLAFLAIKSGLANIISTIPELFSDAEYDLSFGGEHLRATKDKIIDAFHYYGAPFSISAIAVAIAALIYKGTKKKPLHVKSTLLLLAGFLLAAQVICGLLRLEKLTSSDTAVSAFSYSFCYYFNYPLTWFGLACYGLCDERKPRLFAFWVVGETASILIAYASEHFLTLGGEISNIGTVLLFGAVVEDFKNRIVHVNAMNKQKNTSLKLRKQKQASIRAFYVARIVVAVGVCAIVFWRSTNFYMQGFHPYLETQANSFSDKRIRTTIERGPHKGIRTTEDLANKYNDILEDLDQIAEKSDGQAVYFAGNCPFYYLYLNLPYGTYSGWYVDSDSETRQCRYWELHPEKRPRYYYIPLYIDSFNFSLTWESEQERMNEKLSFIQRLAVCNVKKGKAGYIVEIARWL